MSTLTVEGIGKQYGGVEVLQGVDLTAEPGRVTALIGPNGAGKSTLANVISGLVTPDAGTIRFGGEDITGWPAYRRAALGIGRTFQNLELFTGLTVLENVVMGAYRNARVGFFRALLRTPAVVAEERELTARARDALDQLGIGHLAGRTVDSLGFGEAKLLEPARVLAMDPKLMVMDEPAAGLPPDGARVLAEWIAGLARSGIAVLLIEHNMKLVMEVSDYIYVLDHGVELAAGTPEAIRGDARVIEAYLGADDEDDAATR